MKLKVGYVWPDTAALGPGHRYVIWTQGCLRHCYRCTSPELQPLEGGMEIDAAALAADICATQDIDGITISGGEPLLQAKALMELFTALARQRPELTVILFTGYLLEEVRRSVESDILDHIDLLIDGEYKDEENRGDIGLRGSTNQKFHFLTDRLLPSKEEITSAPRRREMHMIGEYEMLTIGIAPRRNLKIES